MLEISRESAIFRTRYSVTKWQLPALQSRFFSLFALCSWWNCARIIVSRNCFFPFLGTQKSQETYLSAPFYGLGNLGFSITMDFRLYAVICPILDRLLFNISENPELDFPTAQTCAVHEIGSKLSQPLFVNCEIGDHVIRLLKIYPSDPFGVPEMSPILAI